MEKKHFDTLLKSLEDAAAFAQGDTSHAKVIEADDPVPAYAAKDVALTRAELNLSQRVDSDHSLVQRLVER